jgi:hypothetical protein
MSRRRRVSKGRRIYRSAIDRWQQFRADLTRRRLRHIGVVACSAVVASVILAKLTQNTFAAGLVRAFTITVFALAAITLLAVVILMAEEVVHELDETDPLRARDGGAFGPKIKRFFRVIRRATRAWVSSLWATLAAWRRALTRESVVRFAHASTVALSGVPPADVAPPRGAGHLARPDRAPPPPVPEPTARERTPAAPGVVDRLRTHTNRLRRRVTRRRPARSSSGAPKPAASNRPGQVRSSRPLRPTGRSRRAAPRTGRTSYFSGRPQHQ